MGRQVVHLEQWQREGRLDDVVETDLVGGGFVMILNKGKEEEKKEQVEQSSDNRCVLWRTARVLVYESSFEWHTFLFLMPFCSILALWSKMGKTQTK